MNNTIQTSCAINTNTSEEWKSPTDEQQPKVPLRVGLAMMVGVILWLATSLGLIGVLIPAKIASIAPLDKTSALAFLATVAMIISTLANIFEGAFSDRTRTRFGRRTPWLLLGSVGSFFCVIALGMVTTISGIIISYCFFMIFLNAIVAPLLAILSDKVAPKHRGTISSMYAIGNSIGIYGGQMVAAFFLSSLFNGFVLMAVFVLLSGPAAALLLKEGSTTTMPKVPINSATIFNQFAFPTVNCRDYYLALFGKLCIMTAKFTIAGYQLYILTDYIQLDMDAAAKYIGYISITLLISSATMAIVSGPVADKIKLKKKPVVFSALMIALGCAYPAIAAEPHVMIVYSVIAGLGYGIFSSLDQALNIEVLPDSSMAAKDLGILNIANNGGQIFGPVMAGLMIKLVGYHGIFIIASITAIFGALLIALIKKVK